MGRVKKLKKLLRHKEILEGSTANGSNDNAQPSAETPSEIQDGQKKKTSKTIAAARFKGT